MGWKVLYPRPKDVGTAELDRCDCCDVEFAPADQDKLECSHPGCLNGRLCIGCAFDCANCGSTFCKRHIIALPADEHLHAAEYLCQGCCLPIAVAVGEAIEFEEACEGVLTC